MHLIPIPELSVKIAHSSGQYPFGASRKIGPVVFKGIRLTQ
jgi:hypothetical protein